MSKPSLQTTILIVDDHLENLRLLHEVLRQEYRVLFATRGAEALEIARHQQPHLILLDVMMPAMDGYEVLQRLREDDRTQEIPVIYLTALTEEQYETRGLELGAVDFITKPFNPMVVRARVRTHLTLRATREDLRRSNAELRDNLAMREHVERINRHDLKSPLNVIIGIPQLLMDQENLTAEQRRFLEHLERAGYRMLEMINNSLSLYKMEIGAYHPQLDPLDLTEILERVLLDQQILSGPKGIRVENDHGEPWRANGEPWWVLGEDLLCTTLFSNLLKNALEAAPEGSVLRLTHGCEGAMAVVRIENEGGIPPEVVPRFFSKYVTGGKADGTGLGAYSARLMAQTMGGVAKLDVAEPHRTRIAVHLPLPP